MGDQSEIKRSRTVRSSLTDKLSARKLLLGLLNGTILAEEDFLRWLPVLLYASLLSLLYISNSYYAESTARRIRGMEGSIKELRYELISTKSDLMFLSKQSEVARRLELSGVKESLVPPVKIFKHD